MKQGSRVTACRIPDEHYEMLKFIASRRNVSIGTYLRVLIREILAHRLQIQMP